MLRHRSARSTAIYAKVDEGALRPLARPWPGSAPGGADRMTLLGSGSPVAGISIMNTLRENVTDCIAIAGRWASRSTA